MYAAFATAQSTLAVGSIAVTRCIEHCSFRLVVPLKRGNALQVSLPVECFVTHAVRRSYGSCALLSDPYPTR